MQLQSVIIGLGNEGKEYEKTRHNVGFQAVEMLGNKYGEGEWKEQQKFASMTKKATMNGREYLLAKPTTYMNLSADAVCKFVHYYHLDPSSQLLVICDDIDIALGEYRLRMNGGPGTHNGLKSIVDAIGEDFSRLRIGIGKQPEQADLATWVLSRFNKEETEILSSVFEQLPTILTSALHRMEEKRKTRADANK